MSERCLSTIRSVTSWFHVSRPAYSSLSVTFYRWSVRMITTGGRLVASAPHRLMQQDSSRLRSCRSGVLHALLWNMQRKSSQVYYHISSDHHSQAPVISSNTYNSHCFRWLLLSPRLFPFFLFSEAGKAEVRSGFDSSYTGKCVSCSVLPEHLRCDEEAL